MMPNHSGIDVSYMEPDVVDKLLFSEDLISYFMGKILWKNTQFSQMNVAPISGAYRGKVYNGFNEDIKGAVDIIYLLLKERIRHRFVEIAAQNEINYISFKKFEKDMRTRYFSTSGIEAIRFLKYCVFLAVLSGRFYECGWGKTPDMAADLITKAFPDGKMSRVSWEMLNMAAKGYTARNKYVLEQSSTKFSNVDFNDSKLNVGSLGGDSDREMCSCFQVLEEGRNFISVFQDRDRLLEYHKCPRSISSRSKYICPRRMSQQMDNVSEFKPRTLKESVQFLHSLDKSENISTTNSPRHALDLARTYREKTKELFGSHLEVYHRPPATLEVTFDSALQQILDEPLETCREEIQNFYRSENESQGCVNPESIFETGHGQSLNAGIDPTLPGRDGLQEFLGLQRGQQEHKPPTLSPEYPFVKRQKLSKWPKKNLSHRSFLKDVIDIYNERVQSGYDNFSVFQKSTEPSPAEVPDRYFLPTAAREERIAHEVEEFFRSRDMSFQEANASTVTVNANSIDRNMPCEQIPSIDYKYITDEFNNSIQNRKEKPLRIGGFQGISREKPLRIGGFQGISREKPLRIGGFQGISKEKPLRIGGFQGISREKPMLEPIDVLGKEGLEDMELQNNFLTSSLYTGNVQNLTERPLRIGGFQSISRDEPIPVLRREWPEDMELQNKLLLASLYTCNIQNITERQLRTGGFQSISRDEPVPVLRREWPEDTELQNNFSQASLYTGNVENRLERPLRIGGFQGVSNEESRTSQETGAMPEFRSKWFENPELSNNFLRASLNPTYVQYREERPIQLGGFQSISKQDYRTCQETEPMRTDSPQDTELDNNLKAKSEVLSDMIDELDYNDDYCMYVSSDESSE